MTQGDSADDRMKLRIERIEREKEKQNLKHQRKIESRDFFHELNVKYKEKDCNGK